jgi:hypothetical protein
MLGESYLHVGYTTPDEYHWICDSCFNDFREEFGWRVTPEADSADA